MNTLPPRTRARSRRSLGLLLLAAALSALAPGNARGAAILDTTPPVVFSVQPEEEGKLVVLPIVPETANDSAKNLFGLRLNIRNNGTNSLTLTTIRTTFPYPDNALSANQFSRDVAIAPGMSALVYLEPDESIRLPEPPPPSVRIDLFFKGYAQPKSLQRELASYTAPTPDGKYLFPGSASDLGPNEYFSHVDPHTGGDQFFAYDLNVQGWNADHGGLSSIKSGTDGSKNEHSVGWGIPIHAMADGVVLYATSGWHDNPAPNTRVIQRLDDQWGEAITDVKVTKLAGNRAATLTRLPSGHLKITVWDLEDRGRELIERGSAQGEATDLIAADALTGSRLLTAIRTDSGKLRLIVWGISTNGAVSRLGEQDADAIAEVSLAKITSSRAATAVRLRDGTLRLTVWDIADDGLGISPAAQATAGSASSLSVVPLGETRLATALQTAQGTLKVIVWDLDEDPALTIKRRGEALADAITKVVAVPRSSTTLSTAMRTAGGDLKVINWIISDDGGSVTKDLEVGAGPIRDLSAIGPFDKDSCLTAIITEQGTYHNILWKPEDGSLIRWGESEAGAIDGLAVDVIDGGLFLSAVRSPGGNLKLIAWWVGSGGGNDVVILHGNCRVLYAHFQDGTLDPAVAYPGAIVSAGQFLGRMGNSGASSGPHTHIHSIRVSSLLTLEEVIALQAQDQLPLIGYRPIPFHCARAMRLDAIQWRDAGEEPNPLTSMQGHGVYFERFGIRPTWFRSLYVDGGSLCFAPNGQKEPFALGRLCYGGPFHRVNDALSVACSVNELFIRAGAYAETVTFNRRMTVRSYDGTAVLGE